MGSVSEQETWQTIAARKQAQRESKIPLEWRIPKDILPSADINDVQDFPRLSGLFTDQELAITETTATDVVEKIASGVWSSEEVVRAVCKRAAIAQQLINCVTEIHFDEAIARARNLDEYLMKEGKTVGPLHGLPISLKDQFNIAGLDSTIGYVSYIGKPATKSSTLVQLLIDAGAVPYIKSNVPATLMMGESINNVFGRTLNPRNRELTTGGSSGGESALVTFRASFLGVGTDIGGSIRHPCSYTGLFGLRPSHGRISYQHVTNTYMGQEAVRSCAGPMCRSAKDVRLFMRSVAAQKPWLHDSQCVPLPWREEEEVLPKQLCFGFGMGDGKVTPTPPLRRAMEITKAKLMAAGHKVIDYVPHELPEAAEIVFKMWSADAGAEFQRDTDASGEPLHPQLEDWLGHSAKIDKQSVSDTWQNQHRRALLSQRWLERWQATTELTGTGRPIDGLIMPSTPFPAVRHDGGYPWHYGALAPLLDLTTGAFPVTKVDLEKDKVPTNWQPISDKDKEVMEYYGKPENHENALVGLAVTGRRLEEEKVTAMLQLISDVVGVDY
ncbi:putative amidase [Elasticomyces elasticus]|nr:putative amidase [Elasticomyces elasticus]KAK3624318.1 putative amidase [Elasticomyces elasticus]KAK4925143.1 putative amidase [Elasticomyces elasticus]KAK5744877.1 putative amidase [Elasticomyces elasticus]